MEAEGVAEALTGAPRETLVVVGQLFVESAVAAPRIYLGGQRTIPHTVPVSASWF